MKAFNRWLDNVGIMEAARQLGVSHQVIQGWRKRNQIPADRVMAVSRLVGIEPYVIRPDIFEKPETA